MSGTEPEFQQTLLIEEIASIYRFDRLAAKLPGPDIYPPYLLLLTFFFIDFVVVNTYKLLTGYEHIILATPTVVAGPLGILLAAVGIRYMSANYSEAIEYLYSRNQGPETEFNKLGRMVSGRTKWAVLGIAALSEYVYVLFIGGIDAVIAFEGPAGLVNVLFVHQFGYLPFVAEFALLYFSIHFLVPKRLKEANIELFHYDPRNMGGFAAIGQLLKRSYYLYTAGLLLYFVLIYGPFVISFGSTPAKPGVTAALFFSLAWFVGIVSIAYSMLRIHRIMANDKEQRIRELEVELQEVINDPLDINSSEITDRKAYDNIQHRLDQVRSTKVYPATFTMWSQIAISVILPQFLQLAVQTTT